MNDTSLSGNSRNRHPVDELADIRARIKELKAREDELKAHVSSAMGDADSLGGEEFIARQRLSERKGGLDEKVLCQYLGVKSLDPYRKPNSTVMTITVEARVHEVA